MRRQPEFIAIYLGTLEFILINTNALFLNYYLDYLFFGQEVALIAGANISWFVATYLTKSYKVKNLLEMGNIITNVFKVTFICIAGVTFIYSYFSREAFPRIIFTAYIVNTFVLIILTRYLYSSYLKKKSRSGYSYKNALVVGLGFEAKKLKAFLQSDQAFGINFMGFIGANYEEITKVQKELAKSHPEPITSTKSGRFLRKALSNRSYIDTLNEGVAEKIIGDLNELPKLIEMRSVDEIFWTLPVSDDKELQKIIDLCENKMVRFYRVPQLSNILFRNFEVELYDGTPVLHYRQEPLEDMSNRFLKRLFDIVFSLTVTVFILSWLIPLVWIVMKFTMPGPLFFIQDRSGKNNKTFKLLKFRSMVVNKEADKLQATKNDSRITKFGAFLRKSSLDEMPQFINVLLGDMTVVGPRPHMLKHTQEYSELVDKFMVRHLIKPGITGWAQVNGYRGGTDTLDLMIGRVEHDVWYIENWSFWLDLHIVIKTITNALGGEKNAY